MCFHVVLQSVPDSGVAKMLQSGCLQMCFRLVFAKVFTFEKHLKFKSEKCLKLKPEKYLKLI